MVQIYDFNFFLPISVYRQNTKEILHKNVSNHFEIIFFENSRKSWVSGKKSTFEPETHSVLWWRSQLSQLGTGFGKKKASFQQKSFYVFRTNQKRKFGWEPKAKEEEWRLFNFKKVQIKSFFFQEKLPKKERKRKQLSSAVGKIAEKAFWRWKNIYKLKETR